MSSPHAVFKHFTMDIQWNTNYSWLALHLFLTTVHGFRTVIWLRDRRPHGANGGGGGGQHSRLSITYAELFFRVYPGSNKNWAMSVSMTAMISALCPSPNYAEHCVPIPLPHYVPHQVLCPPVLCYLVLCSSILHSPVPIPSSPPTHPPPHNFAPDIFQVSYISDPIPMFRHTYIPNPVKCVYYTIHAL